VRLEATSSATEFSDALRNVVREPRCRQAAERLERAMVEEDGVQRAADEIETVGGSP
jgi:UDP:flavonoid glycosyltransferase YjiC (YdhE family)